MMIVPVWSSRHRTCVRNSSFYSTLRLRPQGLLSSLLLLVLVVLVLYAKGQGWLERIGPQYGHGEDYELLSAAANHAQLAAAMR